MCDFRIWHQSGENMYVLQCIECNIFQVRLRNIAFMFHPDEYEQFRKNVNHLFQKPQNRYHNNPIIIEVSGTSMKLQINSDDLIELFYLLDESDTQMKTFQLINGFNQNANQDDL